jgi:hypothetical protein
LPTLHGLGLMLFRWLCYATRCTGTSLDDEQFSDVIAAARMTPQGFKT